MKKLFLTLLISAGLPFYAQMGINTTQPKAGLDVNGDYNLRGKLVVLNATDNSLSEGTHDQVLVSQGEGYPPIWKTLRIPEYEPNKFYLIYNNSFSDRTGVTFSSSEESTIASRSATFTKNNAYGSFAGFKKITGLSQQINVYSTESKTYFQFETVVQANFPANGSTDTSIDYACGIFVDDKLVNVRQRNLKASSASNTFITHNQIGMVQDLSKGSHTVSVACSRLKSYNTTAGITLAIGINAASNINDFISQSSLKVDVYEVPQVFNSIIN
ncbi:hypothetical protein [Chryseobacterium daecheongense]|uniref:Uncharacterized protein n=1 Tax=Chryseobacterium daecheongense TaxID=192389 RepID=A0A3N0VSL5_9FLAO|nr:hypothetical protein [Chryseobacterium daecheongense]ROH95802.1 hypothetical protein EGI05_14860 [Chryseobacterium daecheongense]TDX91808.1 hypothetical protein BCF50_2947 [Chryseobacterium daecheongense]